MSTAPPEHFRETTQKLAPLRHTPQSEGQYDLYPAHAVSAGSIGVGFEAIADRIAQAKTSVLRLDGYVGVLWARFTQQLHQALTERGIQPTWVDVSLAMRDEATIDELIAPFVGNDDPVFGKQYDGELADFFDRQALADLTEKAAGDLTIFYGVGAGLIERSGPIAFIDLPKNEIQYRSHAGVVHNLGASRARDPKTQYKRFYFIDWVVLNQHKANLVDSVDWLVDEQHPETPTIIGGDELRRALDGMSKSCFRARPWFSPGPWGGQWLKRQIPELPQDVENIAWSFELITPENGLMVHDGEHRLEMSFDWLMYHQHEAVLGACADWFGFAFPIRFDFLDTVEGGNLSLQCHPRPEYIQRAFGEPFTQDETYYILDCKEGAQVYLGFQKDVDPEAFYRALTQSAKQTTELATDDYVKTITSEKHGLYLIPNGTVHCSGTDNLVLEISATPYIFTFKMYDWLRLDLDGKPRPLNIGRAYENLHFERQGAAVERELISKPKEIDAGADWRLMHLPTHDQHFYDVHRFEFRTTVSANLDGSPHVMMLVAGTSVTLETADGSKRRFSYGETFVVPAAAGSYRLTNNGEGQAMVVKAFMKPRDAWPEWMQAT
jgi:mannose-6-phosphate isomerase class I